MLYLSTTITQHTSPPLERKLDFKTSIPSTAENLHIYISNILLQLLCNIVTLTTVIFQDTNNMYGLRNVLMKK